WPADNGYLPMLKGQQVINEYEEGQLTASSTNTLDAPAVEWMETSTSVGTWPENFGVSWTESSAREVRLFTGGDATRGRQGLFDLSASLSRESEVNSDVPNWKFLYHGFSPFLQPASPAIIVPPQYINVGTLGKLGNDGHRWKVLPDGKESIATPQAPLTSYTGQLPLPQKYKPYIELTTATTNANLGHDTPKICVGQQVTFTLSGLPSYEAQVGRWNLPQKYVNESWQLQEYVVTIPPDGYWVSYGSVNYRINSDLLTNLTTQCWYVSNLGSTVTAAWNLQFPNGQQVIVLARGSFTVFTPTVGMVSSALHGTPTAL
ncbi:MAG: hypothetical protein NT154_22460, partial [Verrucomicrobia bacterium]|nr:hypothetical protein [Verrucomicrobiota bacterium]